MTRALAIHWLLLIVFCHTGGYASGAATEQDTPALTLEEVVRMGLKRSPKIKKSRADLGAARATTRQYKGALFPQVSLNASTTSKENSVSASSQGSTEDYTAYVEATQPLYAGGAVTGTVALRRQEEEIQQLTLNKTNQDLVDALATAYYDVSEKTRLLQAAGENIDVLKSYYGVIQRYEKIGRARQTDKLQASINLTTAQADLNDLESQLYTEKEKLRELLSAEITPEIIVNKEAQLSQIEKVDINAAVKMALAANPDVKLAEVSKEKVANERTVGLAEDMPSLSLKGQWGYQSSDQPNWFDASSEFSAVSLNLKVPLFSGLSSIAKRRGFQEKQESATRDYELKKLEIERQLTAHLKELESSLERLKIARQAALDSRQALALANRDYQRNLISSQDVISLQRTRYDAEKLFIRTQYTYLRTLLQTRKTMGIDLEKSYATEK